MIQPNPELRELQQEALKSTRFRGHKIHWDWFTSTCMLGHCKNCGKEVMVNTRPEPNEIDIGGEAVALNCE